MIVAEKRNQSCNVCGSLWPKDDLQKHKWAGTQFRWNEDTGRLICPECYEEMKAAFISSPENFKDWKASYGFGKRD